MSFKQETNPLLRTLGASITMPDGDEGELVALHGLVDKEVLSDVAVVVDFDGVSSLLAIAAVADLGS